MDRSVYYRILLFRILILLLPIVVIVAIFRLLPNLQKQYHKSILGKDAVTWSSENFQFYSQHKLPDYQVSQLVEEFYTAFLNSNKETMELDKFQARPNIFIFANRQEFDKNHQAKYWTNIPYSSAFYDPNDRGIRLYYTGEALTLRQVVFHEMTHLVMDLSTASLRPRWSPWFAEGVACYFENAQIVNQQLVIPEMHLANAKAFMRNHAPIKIRELLNSKSKNFKEKNNQLYYIQSHLLVSYFLEHPKTEFTRFFYNYFQAEAKEGVCPPGIFWNLLPVSEEELQQDFEKFLK